MTSETHYQILGVSESASAQAIRAAWDRLSSQPHYSDAETRERFVAIKKAYAILSDPQQRAAYDRERRTALPVSLQTQRSALPLVAAGLVVVVLGGYFYARSAGDEPTGVATSDTLAASALAKSDVSAPAVAAKPNIPAPSVAAKPNVPAPSVAAKPTVPAPSVAAKPNVPASAAVERPALSSAAIIAKTNVVSSAAMIAKTNVTVPVAVAKPAPETPAIVAKLDAPTQRPAARVVSTRTHTPRLPERHERAVEPLVLKLERDFAVIEIASASGVGSRFTGRP